MKVGDFVRTKKRGFQYPQIARIKSMSKDSGYKNQYFIELDHNLLPDYEYRIYKEDIVKSSPNIIDLIEVGDYVNGKRVNFVYSPDGKQVFRIEFDVNGLKGHMICESNHIKSIVTKEQFESMEYKI